MHAFLLLAQAAEETASEPVTFQSTMESIKATWMGLPAWVGPFATALVLAAGLWLLVPPSGKRRRIGGALLVAAAVIVFLNQAPMLGGIVAPVLFWVLAAIAVGAAVAAISVKDPVYSALWFALCLLGVAGLFLYQGAFFLGIATVAVYAGAIVVTFLFVLMLAQPEGHAFYDRMGWGRISSGVACAATAALVGVLAYCYTGSEGSVQLEYEVAELLTTPVGEEEDPLIYRDDLRNVRLHILEAGAEGEAPISARLEVVLSSDALSAEEATRIENLLATQLADVSESLEIELIPLPADKDVLAENHVAQLGNQLFGPHLIAVEMAGALLLAALVGAVAIATRGDEARSQAKAERQGGLA